MLPPQAARKEHHPTLPPPARQDAPFPDFRSLLDKILNGDPAASPTRRRAQTWCSLFVAPCAPEGTPPVLSRLRPRWMTFLSSLTITKLQSTSATRSSSSQAKKKG